MSEVQISCYDELNKGIYNRLNSKLTMINKLVVQVENLACTQSKSDLALYYCNNISLTWRKLIKIVKTSK